MLWIGFTILVSVLLAVDLLVFNRQAHRIGLKEATAWSLTLVGISLAFAAFLALHLSPQHGLEFVTGYLIEQTLSMDNVFVFVLILAYFRVPVEYQHRVLFWGILGAIIGRGVMIGTGMALINRFHWIIYIFGAFLVVTGIRMGFSSDDSVEPEKNVVLRLLRRFVRISNYYHAQKFLVREPSPRTGQPQWVGTPLLVVLVVIGTTDLVFALDSIPAIIAITRDPFIVYSSNVLAVLGMRALYFVLADIIHRFHFLKIGLSVVLSFVGLKMLLSSHLHIPIGISLAVVVFVLLASVAASLLFPKTAEKHDPVAQD
jgi:tellurite resistance protein TerC